MSCEQRGLWLGDMDEEQSEECRNRDLERKRSGLMNRTHSVPLSVSSSFQHDNLCTVHWFLWFFLTTQPSHTPLCLFSLFPLHRPSSSLLSPPPAPFSQPDSAPGPLLVAGYEDGSLMLWDVTQRTRLSQVKAHPEPVMCLTFDPGRLRGVSGSSEKRLSSWTLDRQNNLQVSRLSSGVMFSQVHSPV